MPKGASGELDFSKTFLSADSAIWEFLCILAIVLAAWTTNGVNLYAGALSINSLLPGVKNGGLTLVSGGIGIGLALTGINTATGFQTFLNLIAIFISLRGSEISVMIQRPSIFFRNSEFCP